MRTHAETKDSSLNSSLKETLPYRERTALLNRLLASPQLSKSARLRGFLQFVGRRTVEENCDTIHEQEIGEQVFGRAAGYDTGADNIVRVNATELRKRIESYFESEGSAETLILDIPRGSYKPVFRSRLRGPRPEELALQSPASYPATVPIEPVSATTAPQPAAVGASAAEPTALSPRFRSRFRLALPIAIAAVCLLSLACAQLWMQNQIMRRSLYAWKSTPALRSFWSGILDARPNTDVVLADTSFALIEDILKQPIPLNDYLNRNYANAIHTDQMSLDRREDLNLIASRSYGSVGDFRVAQRIMSLDPLAKLAHLHYAREYMPSLVKEDNVILIGSRKSNPWVDLFVSRLNFTVEYDPIHLVSYIQNRAPARGEQAIYTVPPAPEASSGYSAVAYLPNPDQQGKVLLIQGTGSEATEGAGDFLTSEDQLARFQKLLHVSRLPYFEVLLKTTHLSETPMDATIVAYRMYPSPR